MRTHSSTTAPKAGVNSLMRPFKFEVPQGQLDDLHRRLVMTRWPEKETTDDQLQGVPLQTIQALVAYWLENYDWRRFESRLNSLPNFITEIDGLDIHFIHVKSKHENAVPVIISHGWPYSVAAMLKIIGPLTDPEAYGGNAADAFDVVIPSLPGYGFSGKPAKTGWGPVQTAAAWIQLMERLGYDNYTAQGGDWGALITELMGQAAPPGLMAIHSNMPCAVPEEIEVAAATGAPVPPGLSAEEIVAYNELSSVFKHLQYAFYMAARPQTLTGLADSPAGLAAFLIDLEAKSLSLIARAFAGEKTSLTRDDILDNVSLYWFTNTAVSSARMYRENTVAFFSPKQVSLPVGVTIYPEELYCAPRSWAEKAYPNLVHYNRASAGGHFPAWEQPEIFVEELRSAFKSLRRQQ